MALFQTLAGKLSHAIDRIAGRQLTDEHIQSVLQDIRSALIESDVSTQMVDAWLETVRTRAIGQKIAKSLKPYPVFLKIIHEALVESFGVPAPLVLKGHPAIIMLVGLQGVGKTTLAGKVAHHLIHEKKKSVAMVSVDVKRPGAMMQLEVLARQVKAFIHPASTDLSPLLIAEQAVKNSRSWGHDVLIIDTAGRLQIDYDMMQEIQMLDRLLNPSETWLAIDAMTGQKAYEISQTFHQTVRLTGLVITKADSDAKLGSLLSARSATQKPIVWLSTGEKIGPGSLELFDPSRLANRILDQGDLMSIIQEVQAVESEQAKKASEELERKIKKKGLSSFNLNDFLNQIKQLEHMGGMKNLLQRMPGAARMMPQINDKIDERMIKTIQVMIESMTYGEREDPTLFVRQPGRIRRVALGSGHSEKQVKELLDRFQKTKQTLRQFEKNPIMRRMLEKMIAGQT